jgi:RND family efflux transporter MFP subunit
MKRWMTILLVLVVVAGAVGGFLWIRSQRANPKEAEIIRTAQAERASLDLTIPASGNVSAAETRALSFSIPGTVEEIQVNVNDRVTEGAELASLNAEDLQRQVDRTKLALERAQLDLEEAQEEPDPEEVELAKLAVQSAAQALEVARIGKQTAQADADRLIVQAQRERENAYIQLRDAASGEKQRKEDNYQDALAKEHIAKLNAELIIEQAKTEWESAYTQYKQAQNALEKLQTPPNEKQITRLELQVQQAQIQHRQAIEELSEAILAAPFTGYVADIKVQDSERLSLGNIVLTLVDDSKHFIELSVDEIDIGVIDVDQSVNISLDAYPEAILKGRVDRIAPESIELAGLTSYEVRVAISNSQDVALYEGMTASVNILTDQLEDVLVIPNWAIRADEESGQTYCYKMIEGSPVQTPIETGERNETQTVILSGLNEGDTVALLTEERSLIPGDGPGGPPSF